MEVEAIVDPFSKSRIGNESNPFVADVETGHVSVHDDSDDRQEFNERLSKILFDLQDDGSELSGGESESEAESEEDSKAESKQVPFEPVISENEHYFVVDSSDFPNEYEESTDGADTGEETATMLDPEADCTVYNDETIAASEETLQSILEKVYKKNQEKNRRELDYSKAPKVLVTADKIKELISEICHVCGSAISLQHTMSGTVLMLN